MTDTAVPATGPHRGIGEPFRRGAEPVQYLPIRCPACAGQLVPVAVGPSTVGVVVRIAFRCVRVKCPGRSQAGGWMFTGSLRAMKEHEIAALERGVLPDLDIEDPDLDDPSEP